MDKKKLKLGVGVCLLIIFGMIIGFAFAVKGQTEYYNRELLPMARLGFHWACMDGCYNMEMILLNVSHLLDYDNQTQEEYHQQCADSCFEKYNPTKHLEEFS